MKDKVNEHMETEWTILNKIWEMRNRTNCTKFVGALTIEILRKELRKLGLNVSGRDVFILGIPNELDLLIPKRDKNPEENLIYNSNDVLAVLEIKFRGSYGKDRKGRTPTEKLKMVFDSIREKNNGTKCFYVTISENERHKYRITEGDLGHACFELFTRTSSLESARNRGKLKITGDWQRLIQTLQRL